MNSPDPANTPPNVMVQGLLGVLLGIVVLAVMLVLLHLRRNGLPVEAEEMQMRADSPCMVQAIRDLHGRVITYAELDRLQERCGE